MKKFELTGLEAWLPTDNSLFFGTDRTIVPARFNTPIKKPTYYIRLKISIRAAINAWKYGI